MDSCGVCGGDDSSCNVQLSFDNVSDGSMDIIMSNGVDIAGFQFNVTGVNLTGSSGGTASANGFTVSTSASTVLGFSFSGSTIPAGEDILVTLNYEPTSLNACFDNIVISDVGGTSLLSTGGECVTVGEPSTVSIFYDSVEDIAGFQFGVEDGVTLLGASGGDAVANGFTVSASATTVLGLSLIHI